MFAMVCLAPMVWQTWCWHPPVPVDRNPTFVACGLAMSTYRGPQGKVAIWPSAESP
jgi:hypothetical protein